MSRPCSLYPRIQSRDHPLPLGSRTVEEAGPKLPAKARGPLGPLATLPSKIAVRVTESLLIPGADRSTHHASGLKNATLSVSKSSELVLASRAIRVELPRHVSARTEARREALPPRAPPSVAVAAALDRRA